MVKSKRLKRENPSFGCKFWISRDGCAWLIMMSRSVRVDSLSYTKSSS